MFQEARINVQSVHGQVLQHEHAILVEVDTEVYIAEPFGLEIVQSDIASHGTAPKGEASGRDFEPSREAKNNCILAVQVRHVAQALSSKVGGVLCVGRVRRGLVGQLAQLGASGFGRGQEEAYYVGYVGVGEARILLAYSARVEEFLGSC